MSALALASFLPGAACRAAAPEPMPAAGDAAGEAGPEAQADLSLYERLDEAEVLYDQGLRKYREGQPEVGRSLIRRAFAQFPSLLDSEPLALELKPDFLGMLDKLRAWESAQGQGEAPSDLSVSTAEIRSVQAAAIPQPGKKRKRAVAVDPDNEITRKYIYLYIGKRRAEVEQALARSGRYRAMIAAALRKARLPEELFYLVMAESEYRLNALSRSGAGGLWQFMPFTARRYGLEVSYWVDERYDPEKATQAAIRYLSDLHQWFGDWHLAIAAYNRGEGGIGRDLQFSRSTDFPGLSSLKVLPQETQDYIPKFMACVLIGENPQRYGLQPLYEEPAPYDVALLDRDLDLGVAARCAGTTVEVLRELNPQLRSWCTPKNRKDFPLRLPQGTKGAFEEALAKVKDWNPGPSLVLHRVRRGDSLGRIASNYRTTVKSIMGLNGLKSAKHLRPGMTIKIQPGKGYGRRKGG